MSEPTPTDRYEASLRRMRIVNYIQYGGEYAAFGYMLARFALMGTVTGRDLAMVHVECAILQVTIRKLCGLAHSTWVQNV